MPEQTVPLGLERIKEVDLSNSLKMSHDQTGTLRLRGPQKQLPFVDLFLFVSNVFRGENLLLTTQTSYN